MYIKVRVIAGAREEKVVKKSDDHFIISVKEKARANMANNKILQIIGGIFKTKKVRIVSGHHSPGKLLAVD